MAEHPNVDIVRRGYEAFSKGDMDTLATLMSEDVIWHVPGSNPLSGDKKGRDDTFAYFGQLMERSGGTLKIDLHDIVGGDEHVVGLHHDSAEREGKTLDSNEILIFHVSNGQIVEAWEQYPDLAEFDKFWA